MALTKKQKEHVSFHLGQMAFIAAIIIVLWALVSIAKSQGF